MTRSAGVLVVEHIAAGLVEKNQVVGSVKVFPEVGDSREALLSISGLRLVLWRASASDTPA